MSSVVENWAKSYENRIYFNSDLETANKDSKCKLTDLFNLSASKLDSLPNEPIDTERTIKAAASATSKFEIALYKSNIITKLFISILGLFGFSLSGAYHRFSDKLAVKTAENYKGNLKGLVNRLNTAEHVSDKKFLKRVIQVAIKNIECSKQNKGVIFKITNDKMIDSYLIGTLHCGNEAMTKNVVFANALSGCHELIT